MSRFRALFFLSICFIRADSDRPLFAASPKIRPRPSSTGPLHARSEWPSSNSPMLRVECRVGGNNCRVAAFVDTGAQVTVMSLICAQRCGLMSLVDSSVVGDVRGVGLTRSVGNLVDMEVWLGCDGGGGGSKGVVHLPHVNIMIVEDLDLDMLIGMDLLRRGKCEINIPENMMRFRHPPSPSESPPPPPTQVGGSGGGGSYGGTGTGSLGVGGPSTQSAPRFTDVAFITEEPPPVQVATVRHAAAAAAWGGNKRAPPAAITTVLPRQQQQRRPPAMPLPQNPSPAPHSSPAPPLSTSTLGFSRAGAADATRTAAEHTNPSSQSTTAAVRATRTTRRPFPSTIDNNPAADAMGRMERVAFRRNAVKGPRTALMQHQQKERKKKCRVRAERRKEETNKGKNGSSAASSSSRFSSSLPSSSLSSEVYNASLSGM